MDKQQRGSDPWANAEARYQPEQELRGVVTRVTQLGVFVQIEPGIEGIVYAFELGQGPSAIAGFTPGQEMQLYVKSIDASKKRLELSPRHQLIPGLVEESKMPAAARLKKQPQELPWPAALPLPGTPIESGNRNCPTCQRLAQATWKYCVYCGGSLQRNCPACGTAQPNIPEARYCCECGKPLP